MRNVTIVESNVEPNKEHLWFYNGKLKWFGPNGWEEIYSQASSPTTTPKPVVPPTTTTTSTAPGPGVATTPIGMRVYNYTDATIDIIVSGANSVNSHIPANGDDYIIEGVYPSTSGGNITLYIKVRGSGSISPDIQVNRIVDVNIMGEISGTSIEQFKSILNEGTIDIPYTGSDALHSISLVVSISEGDTTTTSTPIPSTTTTSTTTTTSSTPKPEGPKIATPFGVRIYNNLADKVDITATAAEVVNKSIEPNGATTFQILPVSTGGTFSLHVKSENLHDTVSTIKVYAHGRVGDYNMEYNKKIVNGGVWTFSYDENAALSSIDMNIELSKYVEKVTTTVTPNVG